ncbi:hypothetical protein Xen7305DRAFT_00021080 [Xenococcus sp. PCC 7305]|uniref:hypothetical protein n=1 Tax=Xenococcus sp. PCC 7305 TaxID=102125 RepID=UPI0002AC4176|nr:hypothetical protein [Xenococcus sp. PCC 7305]ELS02394.1 hypothetical protein Xen7305DRAFT_00021080 [Xenococcus sp. PCC 7305]
MKPKFSTLIILIFLAAAILAPFALSQIYIPILREQSFDLLLFLQGELYKQTTGYIALAFVLFEMILAARKRGRGWIVQIKVPGSILMWRRLHIFLGVGLLSIVLIHTIGVNGLNFNAIFLWIFFGVSLSALVGVVAETGIVESPRKRFLIWLSSKKPNGEKTSGISKSLMIRKLRSFWLGTHIILVSIFFVMLGGHIFLVYYYQ